MVTENGDRDRSPIRQDDSRRSPRSDRRASRDKDRERRNRSNPTAAGGGSSKRGRNADCRVYVSNIPYEFKWQELKDIFRKEIGDVTYVELFNDESGKPRGCGIVEFGTPALASQALEKVHRFDINGRKLVVKEDRDVERDQYGYIVRGRRNDDRRDNRAFSGDRRSSTGRPMGLPGPALGLDVPRPLANFNTYGLNPQFLDSLGIRGPLTSKVFVANLDFKVDEKKLEEVFKLAGRIRDVDLARERDSKRSKGWAIIEFDHPVEAVQAISMFNNQTLYDRKMSVRLDEKDAQEGSMPSKLPEGLKSIGMSIAPGGPPVPDYQRMGPGPMGVGMGPGGPPNPQLAALGGLQGVLSLLGNLTGAPGSSGGPDLSALGGMGDRHSGPSQYGGQGGPPMGGYAPSPSSAIRERMYERKEIFGERPLDVPSDMKRSLGGGMEPYSSGSSMFVSGSSMPGPVPPPSSGLGPRGSGLTSMARPTTDSVKINNLSSHVTWQMLREKFSEIGEVRFAELTGRGGGIVRFASEREAQRAIDIMDRARYEGKIIDVTFY
ncbi:heterogeneous nuclear ribonucleoprotein M-like isoform X2 [Artemia franciscana]|uniref:RRM domain-containing protein n=1 Tax=Artemia franciscana TaxID=6661 RepID=A0AA88IB10_ARTSF|nr:hypothetical protein QYM36_008279 [Artemia franciscana]